MHHLPRFAVDNQKQCNKIENDVVVMNYFKSKLSSISALEDRVDSNEDVLNLYGEQLGVHENSISLLENVNVLEGTDSILENRIDELEAADMITEDRLDQLEHEINDTLQDVSDRVEQLENITTSQQDNIDDLVIADIVHDSDINALQDVDSGFEQRIVQLEQGNDGNNVSVGFHARLTSLALPDAGAPIVYGYVTENIGNCYSPDTGIFTARTSGLYFFEQHWMMGGGQEQSLRIMKNGVEQCYSVGNADEVADYNSPSCSAVMELIPGDQVYVTSNWGYDVGSSTCTGFTGFLINAH